MTVKVIDTKFTQVAQARPDSKKRVGVAQALEVLAERFGFKAEGLRFSVCYNGAGQILLAPEVSVPLAEAWLYQNPKAMKSVLRGLKQSAAGEIGPPLDLEDE
ncbi:MAG TPA: hypothetical protein VGK54_00400 [Chloroflexota bacterium]|jgi:hypothetical protein